MAKKEAPITRMSQVNWLKRQMRKELIENNDIGTANEIRISRLFDTIEFFLTGDIKNEVDF